MVAGLRGYNARNNLAAAHLRLGEIDQAEQQWGLALEENPAFAPAWSGLAEVHLRRQRWDDMEEALRRREALDPVDAAVLRAQAHLARGEFAAAGALLRDAIAASPEAVWPRIVLARVLTREGADLDAASAAYREVLTLEPENREAREQLRSLAGGRG